jgi:hypothetical protein
MRLMRWPARFAAVVFGGRATLLFGAAFVVFFLSWWHGGLVLRYAAVNLLLPLGPASINIIPLVVSIIQTATALLVACLLVYAGGRVGWEERGRSDAQRAQ